MTPTPPPIPPPVDREASTSSFLESHGLFPVTPVATSTSISRALACPFAFYLIDRLGIVPALSYSPALSRGSWVHARLALESSSGSSGEIPLQMRRLFDARLAELRTVCASQGITGDALTAVLTRELKDFSCASAWVSTWLDLPFPLGTSTTTLRRFLFAGPLRTLATELPLLARLHSTVPSVITIDRLLYQESTGHLWILDYKSTTDAPSLRLASCPLEIQTRHYFSVTRALLPILISHFGLPATTTLGGMIHVALQKPTINFGERDRPFTLDTSPFKSGPRKGVPRNEKIFHGEPSLDLYLARCSSWLRGEGDYLHEAQERRNNPPVNISWTPATPSLDTAEDEDYNAHLSVYYDLATRAPWPSLYPRRHTYMAENTRYQPFYLTPPSVWPEIIAREGFIRALRYPHLTPSTPEGILSLPPAPTE